MDYREMQFHAKKLHQELAKLDIEFDKTPLNITFPALQTWIKYAEALLKKGKLDEENAAAQNGDKPLFCWTPDFKVTATRIAFTKRTLTQAGITYPDINPQTAPMADIENWIFASQNALMNHEENNTLSTEFQKASSAITANEYINQNFHRFFQKIYNQDVVPLFMKYGRTSSADFNWQVNNLNVLINLRCLAITGLAHLQTKQKTLDIEAWLQASDRLSRAFWTKIQTEDHGFKNFKLISAKLKAHEDSWITLNEFEVPIFIALQDEQYAFFKQI